MVESWEYDANHHMTAGLNSVGDRGQTFYDFAGRVKSSILKDGSVVNFDPIVVQGLYEPNRTSDPLNAPSAFQLGATISTNIDARGKSSNTAIDRRGQAVSGSDEVGTLTSKIRNADNMVTSTTSGRGIRTDYTYDNNGNVVSMTTDYSTKNYTYDSIFNQVTSETDELGRTTLYTIDANTGLVLSTIRVIGAIGGDDDLVTSYTYTNQGQLDTSIDPLGHITDDDYDAKGRLIKTTYAKGTADEASQQFEYDLAGNQTAVIDEKGNRTEYRYDLQNHLIETILPDSTPATLADNPRMKIEYDAKGNQKATIDELGHRTEYQYDALSRLLKMTAPDPDGLGALLAPVTSYEYDRGGNRTAEIDPLGRRTEYQYDARNRLIATIHPDGSQETSHYDLDNNLVASRDANGNVTTRVYDPRGRLIRVNEPNGSTVFEYDRANQLIAQIDANGNRTQYVYDELGRKIKTIDALGGVSITNYDKNGNVISATDQLNRTTIFSYDNRDRQVKITTPLNYQTRTVFDAVGNVIAQIDANNHATTYRYDERDRQIEVIDALNQSTKATYDAVGNVLTTTDALNHVTTNRYDNLYRQVETIDALNQSTKTEYDLFGNVVAVVDPLGQRTSYGYDNRDRRNTVTDALGKVTRTAYDAFGNVLSITDAVNTSTGTPPNQVDPLTLLKMNGAIPSLSSNGRFVTFSADGSIDAKDTNALSDIFLVDKVTESITRISATSSGDAPNSYSYDSSISGDGRYIVYKSQASNVDSSTVPGLFVYDRINKTTKRIANLIPNNDTQLNDLNKGFAISEDGKYIAFVSSDSNIVADDTNNVSDVFLMNLETDAVERISTSSSGQEADLGIDAFGFIGISSDGRYVTFSSNATNLVANDLNGVTDTFVHDRLLGQTQRVSVDSAGNEANGRSYYHSISGNGRYVAFTVEATNFAGNPNSSATVFVRDLQYGTTTRVAQGFAPSIDRDGKFLSFGSYLPLADGDTPNKNDIYRYELATGKFTALSSGTGGVFSKISQDGNSVVFNVDTYNNILSYNAGTRRTISIISDTYLNVSTLPNLGANQTTYEYSLNRLSREVNSIGEVRKYSYDAIGNVTSIVDRDGTTQKYIYDKLNRRVKEDWYDASDNLVRSITNTYNAAGELTQVADSDSSYRYTYDLDGRVLAISNLGTPNVPMTVMTYSYDDVGNVLSVADSINGVLDVTNMRSYDALNRMIQNTQGSSRVDYAYNALGLVTNKRRYEGANLVAETGHVYDGLNRLTNIAHGKGGNNIAAYTQAYDSGSRITGINNQDGTASYSYDGTNQLTGADYSYQSDEGYTYDSNGNRTNSGYVTGGNNQLLEDAKYRYRYDAVGNRIKRIDKVTGEAIQYVWDIRDRLTTVNVFNANGGKIRAAQYVYDVYDQRIAKTVDADGDGVLAATTERFVYGANQNIALAFDGNGTLTHRYLYGNGVDLIEADQQVVTGATLWALADHEGSVRDVVDSSGSVLNHVVYDAFGNVSSQSNSSVVFRFGYTGRELDAESGLQHNRARYFDPAVGRFISEDRIGFGGGDINLYRYVFNSPVNYYDPSGNVVIPLVPVAVGGLFLIGSAAILYLNSLQNQQNSVSPFIDKPEPPDPRPLTFPNLTPTRPETEIFPKSNERNFDPNAINRGKDFGDIGKICRNLGFPLNPPLFPPFLEATRGDTPKDNEKQNKQFKDAVKEIGRDRGRPLTRDEARRLHEEISGEGLGYQDIIETGKSIFGVN